MPSPLATPPSRSLALAAMVLCGALFFVHHAVAQQPGSNLPTPRLHTLLPPAGKVGTTVEVSFTGTDLEEPESLVFSNPALKAEPIVPPAPKPDPKKPAQPAPKPVISKFKVTIPANVPVGAYDVRLVNKWGISNPRTFVVGDLNEVLETEPNNDIPQAQRIEINTTVNGNMANGVDVDYVVFKGSKGQRILVTCLASSIDSRLNPGLELYQASNGRLLTENRNYSANDALVDVVLPEDGDYYVRLYEFTHINGNAEFFYRLSVTTGPWIDAVFPPMVEPGKSAQVTVYGRNLPGGQPDPTAVVDGVVLEKLTVTVTAPTDPAAHVSLNYSGVIPPLASALDGFEYRLRNSVGFSNPMLLTYARAPVVLDNEKNKTPETAQEVPLPCEIAGRVEKRRDRDWYVFTAKKGEVYNFELFSDRLGSVCDMYFILRNAANKQTIVEQDDNTDILSNKFYSRMDDPVPYRFTVPADGKYELRIASRTASNQAGPRHVYRMRITQEQPDFRLVVMGPGYKRPSVTCVRQGGSEMFTVFAWRQDGFNGDIALSVEGLPKGVTCVPQTLGAGLRQALLVVTAAPDAPVWTGEIKVKGTAIINGKPVVREGRSGTITWPIQPNQNLPTLGRLDRGGVPLAVREKAIYNLTATIDKAEVLQGQNAVITLNLARLSPDFKQPLITQAQIQTFGPPNYLPQGLTIQPKNLNPGKDTDTLPVTVAANTPPGTYNIVLRTQATIPYNKDPMAKQKPNVLVVLPSTPVTLTVLPKSVAQVSMSANQVNVKIGMQAEVLVRVNRQFNYDGEFKVKLELPPNVQGVSADEVTIPAGQNEAKLVVKAAANAAPGNRANLTVRATALYNGKTPVTQETKFNVNVVK